MHAALGRAVYGFAGKRLRLRVHVCAGAGCRRMTVEHRALRKDGIFLHGKWLCSPACLRSAVAAVLGGFGAAELHTMPRLPRMPFRLLLLQRGLLSEQALAEALARSECTGLPLGRTLLHLGLVTEGELAASLAAENGCAFYALPPAPVAAEAALPALLAERFEAAAVHSVGGRLLVGFVHRIDRQLLCAVERMTDRKAEGCFITEAHRRQQLALSLPEREKSGSALAQTADEGEAARLIVEAATRGGAEQLAIERVGGLFWVRMWTADGVRDSFFHVKEDAARSKPYSQHASEKKLQVL